MTPIQQVITDKLTHAFTPSYLRVEDFSAAHAGHMAEAKKGGTHFNVWLVSDCFTGKRSVDRHRLVTKILAEELRHPVHALTLQLFTPEEYATRGGRILPSEQ